MDRHELWRVEETAGPQPVCSNEPSCFRTAHAGIDSKGRSAEGPVLRKNAASGPRYAKAGTRRCIDNEAGLIAKLRVRSSRYDFHRLNGVYRDLRRECFALLIVDRLSVNIERSLGVIAERMEESIRIRNNSRRR